MYNLISNRNLAPFFYHVLCEYRVGKGLPINTFKIGLNDYLNGNKSKISFDYQNRPTYKVENSEGKSGERLGTLTLQMQVFI